MGQQDINTLRGFLEQQALMYGPMVSDPIMQHLMFRKADEPLLSTNFFTQVYGAKVWDTLNQQTRFWNLLRKVPWGTRTGWRNRSQRILSTQGIAEDGLLPDEKKSTFVPIYSEPRSVVTPFSVTVKAQFLSGLEGGVGDALALEQDNAKRDHVKFLNQALVTGSHGVGTTSGASGTGAIKPGGIFKPGDTVKGTFSGGAATATILTHDSSTGVVTYTGGTNVVDGNTYVVASRMSTTSIFDVVEKDGRNRPGANDDDPDVYNLTTRTAGAYAAGSVLDNAGIFRNISTDLLDEAIRASQDAGGEPDVIITGTDQRDNISALQAAMQRYSEPGDFKVKMGDETTLPGSQGGFRLATYKGIPIFADVDLSKSYIEDGTAGGSNVLILDTAYVEIAVAAMTQYLESRDFIANGVLGIKGLLWTMFELRCTDITKQAQITDLNASLV